MHLILKVLTSKLQGKQFILFYFQIQNYYCILIGFEFGWVLCFLVGGMVGC